LGLLIKSPNPIRLVGDESLSKRDFTRVSEPLSKFGVKFKLTKKKFLPLKIYGSHKPKPIEYNENRGSAQCKSSVIFAAMRADGTTIIKAKKSRNHTELLCKHLKLPISLGTNKKFDQIKIKKVKKINTLNYNIPSDISSSAFFIVLTALSSNSELIIKNVNINPSRIGIVTILRKMGVKITFKNQKIYKGEKKADIKVVSTKKIKSINCPTKLNSGAIDEFLVIFLVAAKARGISYFKKLGELNEKESPRLKWAEKILTYLGVKTIATNDSIKIFGKPRTEI
jgi:5-enolpyruvylshikimate-3-phosphate synthase